MNVKQLWLNNSVCVAGCCTVLNYLVPGFVCQPWRNCWHILLEGDGFINW